MKSTAKKIRCFADILFFEEVKERESIRDQRDSYFFTVNQDLTIEAASLLNVIVPINESNSYKFT
ncbi:hypothetical protein [Candidatus Enterococcus murrayae]|uniref:Uncharacterized protein n=1 Tax=Candidatus Enterococcus murrayae TaxID=2815321 RepID=A0ABS3HJQ8_9ENTE|nr:hypothetical protein [Enterococcus sp. MJM16]MBO0453680.1 hypothetical protein [Enterococcus sp. MJM16]